MHGDFHLFELILIPLLGSTKIGAFIGCDLLMLLSKIQLTADVLSLDKKKLVNCRY